MSRGHTSASRVVLQCRCQACRRVVTLNECLVALLIQSISTALSAASQDRLTPDLEKSETVVEA